MSIEDWTPDQILLTEMEAFGFRRFGFGHRRFLTEAAPLPGIVHSPGAAIGGW